MGGIQYKVLTCEAYLIRNRVKGIRYKVLTDENIGWGPYLLDDVSSREP